MKKQKFISGFSLIELVVVITIIAILMSVGVVSYRQAGMNARNGKRKTDLESVRQALVLYRSDTASYPSTAVSFEDLVNNYLKPNYLSTDGVIDPKHEAPYLYSYSSDGKIFTLTACLEPSTGGATCDAGQVFTLRNP